MSLPQFYSNKDDQKLREQKEEEKRQKAEKVLYQKNLALDQKKELFNTLSLENKKRCLLDFAKHQPMTCGELEETWWKKDGRKVSVQEIKNLKMAASVFPSPVKYYCWKRENDRLVLKEFDSNFKKTGKTFAVLAESNDLAILIKGEKALIPYGLVTFDTFRNRGK